MRFLFCAPSSYGHLFPALGIALTLRSRGHDIAFVSDPSSDSLLHDEDIRLCRLDKIASGCRLEEWFSHFSILCQVRQLLGALREFRPNVLVGSSFTLGASIVNHLCGIPTALIGLATYLFTTEQLAEDFASPSLMASRAYRTKEFTGFLGSAFSALNITLDTEALEKLLLGDAYLLRTVPELESSAHLLPNRVHLVGDCLWEPSRDACWSPSWAQAVECQGRSTIYVQQSRSFDKPEFWSSLLAAAERLDLAVIASSSRMSEAITQMSERVCVAPYIPQKQAMRYASFMVAGGTTTPVLGALSRALPSLLIPSGGEGPDLANQCERAGVARVLTLGDSNPVSICHALESMTCSSEMRVCLERVSASLYELRMRNEAVKVLEQLASTASPVERDTHSLQEVAF